MARAAEQVGEASEEMSGAAQGLASNPPGLPQARAAQERATDKLAEAIALLKQRPSEDRSNQQDQQGQPQAEQQSGQNQDGGESAQPGTNQQASPEPNRSPENMAQLLQGVRDREARRRQQRAEQQAQRAGRGGGYDTVEKNW